jgi:hypothetical protein
VPLYKKAWWAWWLAIQPPWHVLECPLVRTAHGDNWSSLIAPGANGILSPVASLYWWGKAVLGKESKGSDINGCAEEWGEAVLDVTWMFEGLLGHIETLT